MFMAHKQDIKNASEGILTHASDNFTDIIVID